ncbi:MAG: 30S ribosomal protein S4 [Candidatus Wildermuthbacteria bacterium]|nr:30S ribosomal protein S4 [Candidatus Wildermuthbacteria bacterium]
MSDSKSINCKKCRRLGEKLFLKGDRCFGQKCAIVKRPYPPGPKSKRGGRRTSSEYSKELTEKQKLKNWYNLREKEFKNYVKKILQRGTKADQDPTELLIRKLESRLDNVIFRLGFSKSREQGRQFVSHRYFLVNGKATKAPSYQVKKGDTVAISPQKLKKIIIQNTIPFLKKYKAPDWLELDSEKMEGRVVGTPTLEGANPPAEISAIIEFYSR